jgi:hypothetical protein
MLCFFPSLLYCLVCLNRECLPYHFYQCSPQWCHSGATVVENSDIPKDIVPICSIADANGLVHLMMKLPLKKDSSGQRQTLACICKLCKEKISAMTLLITVTLVDCQQTSAAQMADKVIVTAFYYIKKQ